MVRVCLVLAPDINLLLYPLAKYQAWHGNSLPAETTIRTAGPGGNPFFDISWLAVEKFDQLDLALKLPNTALD